MKLFTRIKNIFTLLQHGCGNKRGPVNKCLVCGSQFTNPEDSYVFIGICKSCSSKGDCNHEHTTDK